MLADQPLITADHLTKLIRKCVAVPRAIAATSFADTVGAPAVFSRHYFGQLLELRGDMGARPLIMQHREQTISLRFDDAAVDIDRPEDLSDLY